MKERLEAEAARMRCENTETIRVRLFKRLDRQLVTGKLTAREVAQAKHEFWEAQREALQTVRRMLSARTRPGHNQRTRAKKSANT